MPSLSIDDRDVNVPSGTTVIQAAEMLGIFIPRYCYHPGLSVAGNCRICLVEVDKVPKLQIACNTPVFEGMVVRTRSDRAEGGRRGREACRGAIDQARGAGASQGGTLHARRGSLG